MSIGRQSRPASASKTAPSAGPRSARA